MRSGFCKELSQRQSDILGGKIGATVSLFGRDGGCSATPPRHLQNCRNLLRHCVCDTVYQVRTPAERKFSRNSDLHSRHLLGKMSRDKVWAFRATFPKERGQAKSHQTFFTVKFPCNCTKQFPEEVLLTLF